MLHDPARHEALLTRAWDESLARRAIYLWDCIRGRSAFPTLDVFYAPA